jgi:hypothetical protein
MEEPKQNKSATPPSNKTVKVKINQGRAIKGVGKAGDVVEMVEALAKQYERDGYVTLVKEK